MNMPNKTEYLRADKYKRFLSFDKNADTLLAYAFGYSEVLFGNNRSAAFFVRRLRLAHFLFFLYYSKGVHYEILFKMRK